MRRLGAPRSIAIFVASVSFAACVYDYDGAFSSSTSSASATTVTTGGGGHGQGAAGGAGGRGGAGGGGGEGGAQPCVGPFIDPFDDRIINAALWSFEASSGGTIEERPQGDVLALLGPTPASVTMQTVVTQEMTSCEMALSVGDVDLTGDADTRFLIYAPIDRATCVALGGGGICSNGGTPYGFAQFMRTTNRLVAVTGVVFGSEIEMNEGSVFASHWKFQGQGGKLTWQTSTDGIDWEVIQEADNPFLFGPVTGQLRLDAEATGSGSVAWAGFNAP
ncbi:MAG: hypothetical protein HOV80_10060 [Polyangiaceae bacterium]|nr:hypothetical protein [Polyangiaceae bacterium]